MYTACGIANHTSPIGGFIAKVALIAQGKGDIYVKLGDRCNEWDSAAIGLVLQESGGRMTDYLGNILAYNQIDPVHRGGIVATNNPVFPDHVKLLEWVRGYAPLR